MPLNRRRNSRKPPTEWQDHIQLVLDVLLVLTAVAAVAGLVYLILGG